MASEDAVSTFIERIRAHHRLSHHVGFWYHLAYSYPGLGRYAKQLGIIPDRGRRIISNLAREHLVRREDIHVPAQASLPELKLFHSPSYLKKASQPDFLRKLFGLNPSEIPYQDIVNAQRWAVGGTVEAMEAAVKDPQGIFLNLGGGFHHAEPSEGGGFCIYNDIAIGIANIQNKGFSDPVAIVDLDYHQGNGNNVAFVNDPSVGVYSIHGSVWTHVESEQDVNIHLEGSVGDERYLDTLTTTLPKFLNHLSPKLIIYIAGTNILSSDPSGTFNLTLSGLLERDLFVIELARKRSIPMVITLAGGYGREAGQATLNLCSYLLGATHTIRYQDHENIHEKYSEIARKINPADLQQEEPDEREIKQSDLEGAIQKDVKGHRLLGFYTRLGVEHALEKYGLLQKVRDFGYKNLKITIDPSEISRQCIRLEGFPMMIKSDKKMLLAEITFHRESIIPPLWIPLKGKLELLAIDWILLQDPARTFSLQSPRLPGQKYPGLGIAEEVQELFLQACKRLHLDGILHWPNYYHIAAMALKEYHFLNPKYEGRLLALKEVLGEMELAPASRAVSENQMVLHDGRKVEWQPAEQVRPISQNLKDYFDSRKYIETALEEKYYLLEEGLHLKN